MNTLELKNIVISKEQKNEIELSQKQIAKNEFQDNDSLDKEIKHWLTDSITVL